MSAVNPQRFNMIPRGLPNPEANGLYVRFEDWQAMHDVAKAALSDQLKLEAEAQALREEVAALRARVVVVPGRDSGGNYYEEGWNACLDELARINAKSISADTLRRIDLVLAALRSHDFHGIINSTIGSNWREQVAEMRGELRELLDEGEESKS